MACVAVNVFPEVFNNIRFTIAALHLLVMWVLNCSELLRVPPRYLTLLHLVIVSLLMIIMVLCCTFEVVVDFQSRWIQFLICLVLDIQHPSRILASSIGFLNGGDGVVFIIDLVWDKGFSKWMIISKNIYLLLHYEMLKYMLWIRMLPELNLGVH